MVNAAGVRPNCIQKSPAGDFLVSFKTASEREKVLQLGAVEANGISVQVEDPNAKSTYFSVAYAPFEFNEEVYRIKLKKYAAVQSVRRCSILGTDVYNDFVTV